MINGAHVIINSTDADKARAFFKDVLGLGSVDAGRGWLIFGLPPSEVACHPSGEHSHEMWLMTDDVAAEVKRLKEKSVEFTMGVEDHGWGLVTRLKIPGAGEMGLYQPKHPRP